MKRYYCTNCSYMYPSECIVQINSHRYIQFAIKLLIISWHYLMIMSLSVSSSSNDVKINVPSLDYAKAIVSWPS